MEYYSKINEMKNPLLLYQKMLLDYDAINSYSKPCNGEKVITLYDNDVCDKLRLECGKILNEIDETYWVEGEEYLKRLIFILKKLLQCAEEKLKGNLEFLIREIDVSNFLVVYNNLHCLYSCLLKIEERIYDFYLQKNEPYNGAPKYPELIETMALQIKEKCSENLGKKDTTLNIGGVKFVINTKEIDPFFSALKMEKIPINHADLLKNRIESERTAIKPIRLTIAIENFAAIIGIFREMGLFIGSKEDIGLAFSSILETKQGKSTGVGAFLTSMGSKKSNQIDYVNNFKNEIVQGIKKYLK